jgi:hypothetical protein
LLQQICPPEQVSPFAQTDVPVDPPELPPDVDATHAYAGGLHVLEVHGLPEQSTLW